MICSVVTDPTKKTAGKAFGDNNS